MCVAGRGGRGATSCRALCNSPDVTLYWKLSSVPICRTQRTCRKCHVVKRRYGLLSLFENDARDSRTRQCVPQAPGAISRPLLAVVARTLPESLHRIDESKATKAALSCFHPFSGLTNDTQAIDFVWASSISHTRIIFASTCTRYTCSIIQMRTPPVISGLKTTLNLTSKVASLATSVLNIPRYSSPLPKALP